MSKAAPWELSNFDAQSGGGQIQFFDPSKVQTGTNVANAPAQSLPHEQGIPNGGYNQYQDGNVAGTEQGWNSDWNHSWNQQPEQQPNVHAQYDPSQVKGQTQGQGQGGQNHYENPAGWNDYQGDWDSGEQVDFSHQPQAPAADNFAIAQQPGSAHMYDPNQFPQQQQQQQQQNPMIYQPSTQMQTAAGVMQDVSLDGPPMQDIPLDEAGSSQPYSPQEAQPAAAQTQAAYLPASSSFSSLPHDPSPFDNIVGTDMSGSLQAPQASQASLTHSRQSSFGNVQFIVGSENTSGAGTPDQSTSSNIGQDAGDEMPRQDTQAPASQGTPQQAPPTMVQPPPPSIQPVQHASDSQHPNSASTDPSNQFGQPSQDLQQPIIEGFGESSPGQLQQPPPVPYNRSPSVQSAKSVDSISHEIRSHSGSDPPQSAAMSPQHHASPHRIQHPSPRGPQHSSPIRHHSYQASPHGSQVSASPAGSTQGVSLVTTPEEAGPAQPSTSSTGVDIFAQPIGPSPGSPFQPPSVGNSPGTQLHQPQGYQDPARPSYNQPPNQPQSHIPQDSVPLSPQSPPRGEQAVPQGQGQVPQGGAQEEHRPPPPASGPTQEDYKHSLSYQMHKHRHEQNMSPATTLWDNKPDLARSPILAPAAPTSPIESPLQSPKAPMASDPQPPFPVNLHQQPSHQAPTGITTSQQQQQQQQQQGLGTYPAQQGMPPPANQQAAAPVHDTQSQQPVSQMSSHNRHPPTQPPAQQDQPNKHTRKESSDSISSEIAKSNRDMPNPYYSQDKNPGDVTSHSVGQERRDNRGGDADLTKRTDPLDSRDNQGREAKDPRARDTKDPGHRDPRDSRDPKERDPRDRDLRDPRDRDPRDPRDPRDRDPRDPRDRDPRDPRDRDSRDPRDRDPRDPRDRDPRDPRDRDPRDPRDRDPRDPRDRDPRDTRDPRDRDPRDRDPRDPRDRDPRDPRDPRERDPRDPRDRDPRDSKDRDSRHGYDKYDRDRYRPPSRGGYRDDANRSTYGDEPYDRPRSRQGYEDDRPRSRQGYRDEYPERPRSRQGYPDDPYSRPRSRQGYEDDDGGRRSRPSSRQGYPDERPKSRTDWDRPRSRSGYDDDRPHSRSGYDRDYYSHGQRRDYYQDYYRQDSRGYGRDYYRPYDPYYGGGDSGYYGNSYYGQPYQSHDHYQKGYLEEMSSYYGNQQPQQYGAQQQGQRFDQQQYNYNNSYQQSTQGEYSGTAPTGGQGEYDQQSQHSGVVSRGSTPGFDQYSESGADNFARDSEGGSRPSSRQSGYEAPYPPHPIQPGYPPPQPGYYPQHPPHPQGGYYHHGYSYGYGAHGYPPQPGYDGMYPYQVKQEPAEERRMTPVKFGHPHVRASFGPAGQLVRVAANMPKDGQPALLEIQDLAHLLGNSPEAQALRDFPGPLLKGETHKNDVLLFCRKMSEECRHNVRLMDRESAQLIWSLLELLIKQNGTVIGTDIAELLLEGHDPSMLERYRRQSTDSPRPSRDEGGEPEGEVTKDRTMVVPQGTAMEDLTQRFRHLLLHGRKKDALEWAMKQGLWGHALFLASKMDAKTHASIMTRFSNTALKMTDPLQTLFQLMSHRQPAAVTLVADEKWGDWRPHLATILSNPTSRPDLDTKSIVTLGDTLASRGCLYASHFCYLMAKQPFGHYSRKTAKLVLIGSSHSLPLSEFASTTAIQCTEVYEYARSLADPTFSLPAFHTLKFMYTVRLADCGLQEEALHYCEVLASTIIQAPHLYSAALVTGVHTLASRLKLCDPRRLQSGEEATDPSWLTQLAGVEQAFMEGSIQTAPLASDTPTPQGRSSTTASSEVGDIMLGGTAQYPQPTQPMVATATQDQLQQQQGFTSIQPQSQQWAPQPQTWDQNAAAAAVPDNQAVVHPQEPGTAMNTAGWGDQTQTDFSGSYLSYMPQEPQHAVQASGEQQPQTQEPINIQPSDPTQTDAGSMATGLPNNHQPTNHQPGSANEMPANEVKHEPTDELDYYKVATQSTFGRFLDVAWEDSEGEELSLSSLSSELQEICSSLKRASPRPPNPFSPSHQPRQKQKSSSGGRKEPKDKYKMFGHVKAERHQFGDLSPSPPDSPLSDGSSTPRARGSLSPTTPSSSQLSNSHNIFQFGVAPPATLSHRASQPSMPLGASASHYSHDPPTSEPPPTAPPGGEQKRKQKWPGEEDGDDMGKSGASKQDKQIMAKKGNQKAGSSGWLGSIFKFGKTKGNEMKLPDDKNPTIVWDEATKSWKNTDPNAEDTSVSKEPPPKDSELTPSNTMPAGLTTPAQGSNTPPMGSNRFSRQKTRGARGQYVDVLGANSTKSAAAPSNLFNVLPKSASMPAKLFVPAAQESENLAGNAADGSMPAPVAEQPQEMAQQPAAASQPQFSQLPTQQQPQFYNPSATVNSQMLHPPVQEEDNLSRSSSQSSLALEVQHYMHQQKQDQGPTSQSQESSSHGNQASDHGNQMSSTMAPPPAMPVMFNPAQFGASSGGLGAAGSVGGPPSARGSLRYGQRRAYPK